MLSHVTCTDVHFDYCGIPSTPHVPAVQWVQSVALRSSQRGRKLPIFQCDAQKYLSSYTEAIKVLLETFSQLLHKAATMMSETVLHLLKKRCVHHMSLLQQLFKGAHCCHQIRSRCLGPEPWDFDEMLKMTQAPCCHHLSNACKAWPWHPPAGTVTSAGLSWQLQEYLHKSTDLVGRLDLMFSRNLETSSNADHQLTSVSQRDFLFLHPGETANSWGF